MWCWFAIGWAAAAPKPASSEDRWEAVLDKVAGSVVSLRMDRPRAFEGVGRSNSQATGFVVDAELGLVLTNRHVVTAGPVFAEAVFQNNEEVDLVPVYRDPIHDFGIFRYDPAKLRFNDPTALQLAPEGAKVGVEVRVLGNDSGERLSILDGIIARTDRPAPVYGGGYSDYDTFYIQAASSTSGGSSGSPVIDAAGRVVALNAGGKTTAATSFYLPLERVRRALTLVREALAAGKAPLVPRGTLQTRMEYTSFDEVRRLGVTPQTEATARKLRPEGTGMLVVREVQPQGPADGKLRIGDVLVAIESRPALDFVTVEEALDASVGGELTLTVERAGKTETVKLTVDDLTDLVPDELVELGGGTVHDLSIHQARSAQIPLRGAYVADAGQVLRSGGVSDGKVIVEIDGQPVSNLADFIAAISRIPDGAPFAARFYAVDRPQQVGVSSVRMNRQWFPVRHCRRNDAAGAWDCADLAAPTEPAPVRPPLSVPTDDRRGRALQPSLVGIRAEVPLSVAGTAGTTYFGAGLVVDAAQGLVVVDRDTVPIAPTEVRLIIAGAFEIPAQVVALHEIHNLAVLRYTPADLGEVVLESATLASARPERGDRAYFVGLESDGQLRLADSKVTKLEPLYVPASGTPRFRETNLDVLLLEDDPPAVNGVLVNKKGLVTAFWASFSYNDGSQTRAFWKAIPADVVQEAIALANNPQSPSSRALGWELSTLSLPRALERGLAPVEAERLVQSDPEQRSVLQILKLENDDPLEQQVQPGDLLLAVDGEPVTRFRQVEEAIEGQSSAVLTLNGRWRRWTSIGWCCGRECACTSRIGRRAWRACCRGARTSPTWTRAARRDGPSCTPSGACWRWTGWTPRTSTRSSPQCAAARAGPRSAWSWSIDAARRRWWWSSPTSASSRWRRSSGSTAPGSGGASNRPPSRSRPPAKTTTRARETARPPARGSFARGP
jgi:pro-apoptotic serine protease NMA111